MKLSIIIPVYNEEKTIGEVLKKIDHLTIPDVKKEIVVVDDGSKDRTPSVIKKFISKNTSIKYFHHERNRGKGAALRTGMKYATGDYITIQDADLEYNPNDIPELLKPIVNKKAKVVYGTRLDRLPNFNGEERTPRFLMQYLGNRLLSLATSILYGNWLTDMETCYKVFPRKAVTYTDLQAKSFDFEAEITAKLLKKGYKIMEIPITANPRTYAEGKKLRPFREGYKAIVTLIKYRFR